MAAEVPILGKGNEGNLGSLEETQIPPEGSLLGSIIINNPLHGPRGREAMLVTGGIPEVFSPYMAEQIQKERQSGKYSGPGPLERQFVADPELEKKHFEGHNTDSLHEQEHLVAPGLVYKYPGEVDESGERINHGRVLWTLTLDCATYCRFCTRAYEVGTGVPHLTDAEIEEGFRFIEDSANNRDLREVILSGGDPLTLRPDILQKVLRRLQKLVDEDKLDIVRIGTRLPIHNPRAFADSERRSQRTKEKHRLYEEHIAELTAQGLPDDKKIKDVSVIPSLYEAIAELKTTNLMVHVNCAEELTEEVHEVWDRLYKECGVVIRTQTVLLKGVNDTRDQLYNLFLRIVKFRGVPHYVYQNDQVYWAGHFSVAIREAIKLWQSLRERGGSSLLFSAKFVIDAPGNEKGAGYGKIVIPEGGAWNVDYEAGYLDVHGTRYSLDELDKYVA